MSARLAPPGPLVSLGLPLVAGLLALSGLSACDDTIFNTKEGGAVDGEGYDGVVSVFEANCLSCHSAGAKLGGLDLETDPCAAIVDVSAANSAYGGALLVSPGDTEGSVLWHKITDSGTFGDVMPTGGAMDQANIDIVANWIADGASCESGGGGGGDGGDDTGEPQTWSGDYSYANVQNEILTPDCATCHVSGGVYGDLPLTQGDAYPSIVGKPSSQGMNYIEPGDPDNSYLYLKMVDDESISGGVMPQGGALSAQYLDLMRGWIAAGASE